VREQRRLNGEETENKCTLSMLVSNLFVDKQRPFYPLLGILNIKNPE